ncbi:MAG: DNA gyrase inhibitor YacG [Pseudomonadota bacterium]
MTSDTTTSRAGICPICKAPTVVRYRPFCSKRCADIDLGRWMTGRYSTPVEEEDDAGGDGSRA